MSIWLHILTIIGTSLVSTILLFPISSTDAYLVTSMLYYSPFITIPIMLVADGLSAILAYKLAWWLVPKIVRKEKAKAKMLSLGEKLDKYGWWLVMIAAATPVPYTLSLYLAGSTRWGNVTRTTTAVVVGKLLRYAVIAVITYYGYQLF